MFVQIKVSHQPTNQIARKQDLHRLFRFFLFTKFQWILLALTGIGQQRIGNGVVFGGVKNVGGLVFGFGDERHRHHNGSDRRNATSNHQHFAPTPEKVDDISKVQRLDVFTGYEIVAVVVCV
jgi:hypothetical protein